MLRPNSDGRPVSMLDAALWYASLGLRVFPLPPGSKEPYKGSHGFEDATTDAEQITSWWGAAPRSNIGIATGHLVDVVDIDGPEGEQALAELLDRLGKTLDDFAVLAIVTTPRGRHLYVHAVEGGNSVGLIEDVDVRALGGYVVAPPSVRPEGDYTWTKLLDVDAVGSPRPDVSLADVLRADQRARKVAQQTQGASQNAAQDAFDVRRVPVDQLSEKRRQGLLSSMLDRAVERLRAAQVRTRNHELNRVSYTLGGIVHLGLDEQAARARLYDVARQIGLTEQETLGTLDSGFGKGKLKPMSVELAERELAKPVELVPSIADDFWDARDELSRIRQHARARMVSPLAVLGGVLARVVAVVDPKLVLPPTIGGVTSLNLFVALVGTSGSGKGASDAAAESLLDVDPRLGDAVVQASVGTGEGIAHLFAHREKGVVVQHATSVLMNVAEVDTMTAINHRRGSTLSPELRKGWEGARLGFAYADPTKRLPIAAHGYRFCLLVGVQPARAGALLDDSDGGTPQRFVWLPTVDHDAPDVLPEVPKPITWATPLLPEPDEFQRGGLRIVRICDEARQAIQTAHRARLRGEDSALDSHALLCRLKVAAALALLDGHCGVRDDDWQLAGTLMGVSDATRGAIIAMLQRKERSANLARGHAEADRDAVRAERSVDDQVQRAARSLRNRLAREGDWITWAELRRGASRSARIVFEDAIESLQQAGQIDVEDIAGQGQPGRRIRLSAGGL